MICVYCPNPVHPKRVEAGYKTCKPCGAREAEKERQRKLKCSAPAYNKGGYQYVTSPQMARDVGKK